MADAGGVFALVTGAGAAVSTIAGLFQLAARTREPNRQRARLVSDIQLLKLAREAGVDDGVLDQLRARVEQDLQQHYAVRPVEPKRRSALPLLLVNIFWIAFAALVWRTPGHEREAVALLAIPLITAVAILRAGSSRNGSKSPPVDPGAPDPTPASRAHDRS